VHDFTCGLLSYGHMLRALTTPCAVVGLRWSTPQGEADVSLEALAAHYNELLVARQPHGPYLLLGYSIGGTIAWEMARQLEARGERVGLLALVDTPNYVEDRALLEHFLATATRNVLAWLRGMSWATKLAFFSANLGGANVGRRIVATVRAQRALKDMAMRYQPGPVGCPVTLFVSDTQRRGLGPDLGWGELASSLEIVEVGGDHITVMDEDHGAAIAQYVDERLPAGREGGT
jgi:thioesterase domain-containing protein